MADMDADDFHEEDEPIEKIKLAFGHGAQGVTAPPAARGQTQYLRVPGFALRLGEKLSDSTANKLLPN
jgi:hypothetical protein